VKGHFHRWTIDPMTRSCPPPPTPLPLPARYPTTSFHFNQERVFGLFDSDQADCTDSVAPVPLRKRSRRPGRAQLTQTIFVAD
jgi:hypothetical protein